MVTPQEGYQPHQLEDARSLMLDLVLKKNLVKRNLVNKQHEYFAGSTNEDLTEPAKKLKREEKTESPAQVSPKKDVTRKKQETPTISLRSGMFINCCVDILKSVSEICLEVNQTFRLTSSEVKPDRKRSGQIKC